MPDTQPPSARLLAMAHADGGWGYRPDQPAHLEPTCLALLALAQRPETPPAAVAAGVAALARHALPDGSYRLSRGRPQAVWPTALVLLTLARLKAQPEAAARTVERLLSVEGRVVQSDPEVADMLDIDLQLLGWPWAEDTFSWVEPTAWACLALRSVGRGDHPRVQEGLRLLLDRAFDEGGVNYGNRVVLGKPTEPIPGPTAVMLLALQGVRDVPRVDAAKGYLRTHARKTADLEHLAWIKLALSAHADDEETRAALPELDRQIAAAVEREAPLADGLGGGPLRLALALLAAGDANPFALTDAPVVAEQAALGSTRAAADVGVAKLDAPKGMGDKIKSRLRGFLVNGLGKLKALPPQSRVNIARADDYDGPLLETLKTQFAHFRDAVPIAGKRVLLKPNLVEYHRDKVINTDPRFVEAVIRLFQGEGASEVVVAEGPGHWRNVQYLVNESGLGDVLRRCDVRFVDINHDEPVKVLNLGRTTGLEHLYLSRAVLSADVFVSLPKLKTHHWAGVTLSLKNLFGSLPGICYGWPKNELHWRGIPNSVVDIACTHTPHLAIVDGVIGMEGDGPLNGTPKHVGALVMGTDLVAVDATCTRIMGMPVERITTLRLAHEKRLGHVFEDRIAQIGGQIADFAAEFAWPPQVEKQLLSVAQAARR